MIHPYQFLELIDDETPVGFDLWLFHETQHVHLQSPTGWRTFAVKKKNEIVAQVRFHIHDGIARASLKSPFGTIQSDKEFPVEILFSFLQFFEDELKKSDLNIVVLKNPPMLYAPHQLEILSVSLLNSGYKITNAEIGAVINIKNSLEEKIDSWEGRKLKQAEESGLAAEQWELGKLEVVYKFIEACRLERGQSLSLSYREVKEVVQIFSDRFLLSVVRDKEKIAAASIGIKINQHILYNFYSGHPKEYDHVSPVVLLIKSLYQYCKATQIDLLDLGTSALEGKPNVGLLDFKLRLGATPTAKYTFQKELK